VRKSLLLLSLAIVTAIGCRTNPACERQIGLMRAELIALEDRYYELESKYRAAIGNAEPVAEDCQPIYGPIEIQPDHPLPEPTGSSGSDVEIRIDPSDASQSTEHRAAPIATLVEPDAKLATVTFQTPKHFAMGSSAGKRPERIAVGDEGTLDEPSSLQIIDPHLLQGRDDDGIAGDDGVSFMLRFPAGTPLTGGELSVAAIDPSESGERQRIGLWRYSTDEIRAMAKSPEGRSAVVVPMSLSWNLNTPRHDELLLFIRWSSPGQAPLELSQSIHVTPDQAATRSDTEQAERDQLPPPDEAIEVHVLPWQPDR
jgi:hypothetical protein